MKEVTLKWKQQNQNYLSHYQNYVVGPYPGRHKENTEKGMERWEKVSHTGNCFQFLKMLWSPFHATGVDWMNQDKKR